MGTYDYFITYVDGTEMLSYHHEWIKAANRQSALEQFWSMFQQDEEIYVVDCKVRSYTKKGGCVA